MKADLPGALADVEASMKLQPASQSLLLHASLLAASGKFEEAQGELNVLRQVMPDNPDVLLQVAAVHQATRQSEKAIETYSHLLALEPANAAALRGRGDTYLNQGQQASAIADYEEALKFDEDNSGVLNNLAWVLATSPDDKLRNGKRAIELATEACEVTEFKQAHILSTLAASYAESGNFDAAIEWSQKAVAICTDHNKEQLGKELESYQAKKPWREATPPELSPVDKTEQDSAKQESGTPSEEETARAKRGT
jgi:tetratricopeptide (TPR) repeat protein